MKKALVVGAGFAGAVTARELAEAGWEVLVIDRRYHVAGNAYDFVNEHGIRVHKYGPHLWHGSNDVAQAWASQFTEWVDYRHKVKALLPNGTYVPLPINKKTIEEIFGYELYKWAKENEEWSRWSDDVNGRVLTPGAHAAFLKTLQTNVEVKNSLDHVTNSVGEKLCNLFFAPYTKKMWAMDLKDLPASIAARIPTNVESGSDLYFPNDKYQLLPKRGYEAMFLNIFDHPNIKVKLNTAREELAQFAAGGLVKSVSHEWDRAHFDAIFTSEPIDVFYRCDIGELPWRSVRCHTFSIPFPSMIPEIDDEQPAVVNFTHNGPHTRMTEWKNLPNHGSNEWWTTVTIEEPCDYRVNNFERYYPVKTAHEVDPNRELYKRYRERAKADGIHFIGRCGRYTYLDMQPCINSTLAQVKKFLAGDTIPSED